MAGPLIVADCADVTASQEPGDGQPGQVTMTKHHAGAELMLKSPQLMKQNFSIWSKWTRQDGLWKDVKSMKLIFDKLIALVETQKERLQKKSQKVLRSKSSAEASSKKGPCKLLQ